MDDNTASANANTTVEERLHLLVRKIEQGDSAASVALEKLLDDSPDFWQRYGDLVALAETTWLTFIAEKDILLQKSVRRKLDSLKEELAGSGASPLEKLLAERIALCWLQVQYADASYPGIRGKDATLRVCEAAERRQDRAQRRYLQAVKELALVRKLLLRTPSPLQIATRGAPDMSGAASRLRPFQDPTKESMSPVASN